MWFYFAALSALLNSFANIARRTHGSLANPTELAWWSLLLGLPLNVGLLLVTNRPMWTSHAYIAPALVVATFNVFGMVLGFRAYKYGDASVVSPLGNLLPIALLVTSFLIVGTVPTWSGVAGVLLVVAGVYYSSVSGKHTLLHPLQQIMRNKGSRALLGWVAFMSVSTVFAKIALKYASPAYIMLVVTLWQFVLLSLYLLFRPRKKRLQRGEKVLRKWGWHLAAIAVFGALSVFFQYQAMDMVDPSYVIAVKRLDVLFTVLFAGLFLHEKHILRRFQGSVIALIGIIIIYMGS